jgi:predicted nucleotidyltransferase
MQSELYAVNEVSLKQLCCRHGVSKLRLFGSVLRGDFDPERSDVDVLVEFLPGQHQGLFKLLALEKELTDLFGRKVDLNTPGSLSKYFRDDAVASSQVLYDAA